MTVDYYAITARIDSILWELETYIRKKLDPDVWEAVSDRIDWHANAAKAALDQLASGDIGAGSTAPDDRMKCCCCKKEIIGRAYRTWPIFGTFCGLCFIAIMRRP